MGRARRSVARHSSFPVRNRLFGENEIEPGRATERRALPVQHNENCWPPRYTLEDAGIIDLVRGQSKRNLMA
jgi:hypothetical protein